MKQNNKYKNGDDSMEAKLNLAEKHLENSNYKKAEEVFTEITKTNPDNYIGWWGLVKALTNNFTKYNLNSTELGIIKDNAKTALSVASEDEKEMIKATWNKYKENFKKNNGQTNISSDVLKKKAVVIQKQFNELNEKYYNTKKHLDTAEAFEQFAHKENCLPLYILMGVSALIIILDLFLNICPGWGKLIYIVLLALIIAPVVVIITAKSKSSATMENIDNLKIAVNYLEKQLSIKTKQLEFINDKLDEKNPKKSVDKQLSKQTEYQLKILQQLYDNKKITYPEYKRKKKELLNK